MKVNSSTVCKTGMEPWFQFWDKVKYAIQEIRKDYKKRQEYKKWQPKET